MTQNSEGIKIITNKACMEKKLSLMQFVWFNGPIVCPN